jgi:2-polyprenyl-6-methoxyphenol hydroxylase-like FAD-dependent oxidoreductase
MSAQTSIVGAGLSGLCVAQALVSAGFDVHVYERDPGPHTRPQGYRLTTDALGVAALKFCLPPQLFEAVCATASTGSDVGYMRFTNQSLGEIFTLTFKHDGQGQGGQVFGQLDRSTLRTIMLSGLSGRVHFGAAVTDVETANHGAVLRFSDGSSVRSELVVGADGVNSRVRAKTLPGCPIIDTGTWGIYGKTPLVLNGESLIPATLEDSGVLALGGSGRFFFYTAMAFDNAPQDVFDRLVPDQKPPITEDYLMWAIACPKGCLGQDVWQQGPVGLHQRALDAAADYHPLLRALVEHADVDYTTLTPLSAATRPKNWPVSAVTLMGDAAHAMPPTGAHGGNTALRDAALLASTLQRATQTGTPLQKAVGEYQQQMMPYAFREVKSSVAMLRRTSMRNPLARMAMLRLVPSIRSLLGGPLI